MGTQGRLGSAVLWASAIIASALLGGSDTLTLVVLPALAAAAWIVTLPRMDRCAGRGAGAA